MLNTKKNITKLSYINNNSKEKFRQTYFSQNKLFHIKKIYLQTIKIESKLLFNKIFITKNRNNFLNQFEFFQNIRII